MDLDAEGFVLRGRAVSEAAEALGLEIMEPSGGGARLLLPLAALADMADQHK